MATGNEQNVSITASTNLTDEDIDKAVKDAEAHAEEDKKRKEEIEVKNNAESLIYNSEKTLKDLGDKISGEEKAKVETEIDNTKKALETNDTEKIKEVVNGKKVTVYEEKKKTIKKDKPSRLNARRQILSVLYPVTEVPKDGKKKRSLTKKVDMAAKLFDEIAPKYADRKGGYTRIIKIGMR